MAKSCIGLDIGTSAIKVAQVTRIGNGIFRLDRLGVTPVPIGAIEGGTVNSVSMVARHIVKLLRQYRIGVRQVMAAVAGEAVIVRMLKFPAMPRKELAGALGWESEKHLPYPVNEAIIDFDVIDTDPATGEQEVLLVAAHRSLIESHVAVLKEAKLQALAIDVQPFALARTIGGNLAAGQGGAAPINIAVIDVGAGTTDLTIFEGEIQRFTRIIPIAGHYFTHAIAAQLGVSDQEAEALKIARGQVPLPDKPTVNPEDERLCSAIGAVMRELAMEIRRSLDFYRLQYHSEITRLVATGGGTALRNMSDSLESELSIRVEIADPFTMVQPSRRVSSSKLLNRVGSLFCVAIGLALRGVQE